MTHPVPTKSFLQPSPEAAMLLAHFGFHLPCPALSAAAEPKLQGHCRN